jgi:hypothetical protein
MPVVAVVAGQYLLRLLAALAEADRAALDKAVKTMQLPELPTQVVAAAVDVQTTASEKQAAPA